MHNIIDYTDFTKVVLAAGTVVRAEPFPEARKPALKVWVDFGPNWGVRQTSAQITQLYTPESLLGTQVVGCLNLGDKKIAGFVSQFLLVGFSNKDGHITLARPEHTAPNGNILH